VIGLLLNSSGEVEHSAFAKASLLMIILVDNDVIDPVTLPSKIDVVMPPVFHTYC